MKMLLTTEEFLNFIRAWAKRLILFQGGFSGRTCHWSPKSQQRQSAHLFHFWFISRLVTLFFIFLDGSFKNILWFALQLPSRESVSLCGYL